MQPNKFSDSLIELQEVLNNCVALTEIVNATAIIIRDALLGGNKLLTCGNGGSAADALHLSEELIGRYKVNRRPLPSLCLNADATAITCICNDYGYEQVFSRPLLALGSAGDVLVGFSTSGNSVNVIEAIKAASQKKITTILLTGRDGGIARSIADHSIIVPSETIARIQEIHTLILHQWLEILDYTNWDNMP